MRARSGEYPTTRLGSMSLICCRWDCACCWCGRWGTLLWNVVAIIKNLQRPDKPELDSGTGGCYAFYAYIGRLAAFRAWSSRWRAGRLIFVLHIARYDKVSSTSFAAKTGGCIYRLSKMRGLLGHSTP